MRNTKQTERYRSLLEDEAVFRALMESHNNPPFLEQMKKDNPEKEQDISDLQKIFTNLKIVEKDLSPTDKEKLWKRIEIEQKRNYTSLRLRNILKYAAVVLILLLPSLYFFREKSPLTDQLDYTALLSEKGIENDSIQNVLLVFSNEKVIEMTEQKVELAYDAEGNLSVNSSQMENISAAGDDAEYNQLYVPHGKTTEVRMSDGTQIWVNSGSRLIYPVSFSGDKREIFLEGEIYLEVARNEKVPFIVKTNQMEVEVLGTAFNVSAYTNDDIQSVVLANGSVSVKNKKDDQPMIIKPNQRYTLATSTNTINLDTVDVFYHICWRYNLIMSESECLSVILKKLERHYNVRIDYNVDEINHIQVKGKLDLKNNIEETLRVISMTTPVNYSIEKESIKLSVKP